MNDSLDIYNNTNADVVLPGPGYTVPANSYVAISAIDAIHVARDPLFTVELWNSTLGVSVYGQDLGYGLNSSADLWMKRIANQEIQY